MWHLIRYDFLSSIRQKASIFWFICFPIILSTLFYVSFGNIYQNEIHFQVIPTAVVIEQENEIFQSVLETVAAEDDPLLTYTTVSDEEAKDMLENQEITGIFYINEEIRLAVAGGGDIKASILEVFLNQYEQQKDLIVSVAKNNPQQMQAVVEVLQQEVSSISDDTLTQGNMDPFVAYFFNLIAMVALFGTTSCCIAIVRNQANLSTIGMRKSISPTHRLKTMLSCLISSYLVQLVCVIISITYILFVLDINMGDRIPAIYLSGAISTLTGVTIGFFIGSIGRLSENTKTTCCLIFSLGSCALSGLMDNGMKGIFAQSCPIINHINPATVMSDLFYCLIIYDDYQRYTENLIKLAVMAVLFTIGGFLLTRRKKYAHL